MRSHFRAMAVGGFVVATMLSRPYDLAAAKTNGQGNNGCNGSKARLVSFLAHKPIFKDWLEKKDRPAIEKELMKKIADSFLVEGRELTPESQAMVRQTVKEAFDNFKRSSKDREREMLSVIMLRDNSGHFFIHDIEPKWAKTSLVVDLNALDGEHSTVPIHMDHRPSGGLRGMAEFFRDLVAPKDAAGRELRAVTLRDLQRLGITFKRLIPLAAATTVGTSLVTPWAALSGVAGYGLASSAILGPKVKTAVRDYRQRRQEIYYRDPSHLTTTLEEELRKATRKLDWTEGDVAQAAQSLGQEINQSLLETRSHIDNLHVKVAKQGRQSRLNVVAVVASPDQLLENYPLTFELPLTKKSSRAH